MEFKKTDLEMLFSKRKTENYDDTYNTTGNLLLDILFMTEFYQKDLSRVPNIGDSDKAKIFSMFVRDPRHGLGRRDLGRHLMLNANLDFENIVKAGRYDDLLEFFRDNYRDEDVIRDVAKFMITAAANGDGLAKKWLPRFNKKDDKIAKEICKLLGLHPKEYRKIIKNEETVEYKLSYHEKEKADLFVNGEYRDSIYNTIHPLAKEINYEHVPSLAMIKYFQKFLRDDSERFGEYLEAVKSGEKKINVATTTVYDIYRNRDKIDADLFIDNIEKIKVNAIPILDTSSSMMDRNDSFGKALSIAHYIGKSSTFAPNKVISFSSEPQLMTIDANLRPKKQDGWYSFSAESVIGGHDDSNYTKELMSLYTGDISNTDFGAVMDILRGMKDFPDFLVVLSDMDFDEGSSQSKDETMELFKTNGAQTKIVWWNFNSRREIAPETDEYGNIYLSGYSPQLLKFLETGFDGEQFLNKLLDEYVKAVF